MSADPTAQAVANQSIDPWLLWVTFFSTCLVFVSLWLNSDPLWHGLISTLILITLWLKSAAPLKTMLAILVLVSFLALLQILFSPFMRQLFVNSLAEGFHWSDWQYLLFAVERFAWPLVIVSTFQSRLSSPAVIARLTMLMAPLVWLGLKIDKLQIMIILALKFLPELRREWDRFTHFQTYFAAALPTRNLRQKLNFWQGVLRAMISQTIHRAVGLGELLALKGFQYDTKVKADIKLLQALAIWLPVGGVFFMLDWRIFLVWLGLTIWLSLVKAAAGHKVRV